jgi:hypothetical protein
VIPKNTLRDGTTYRAQVIASRKSTSDATGYPGVPAWAVYSRLTEFTLRTIYPTLDVNWYGVAKSRRFTQDSVLPPVPESSGSYKFTAFGVATDPLNVLSASVKLPNGTAKQMSAAGAEWSVLDTRDTQQQLESSYASGGYELDLQTTHNGTQRLQLPLNAAGFPLPIQISNWNDASAIDPSQPFALRWAAIPGATADDFIQVTIRKNGLVVFRSPAHPLAIGALNGVATAVTVPPGLLQPGEAAEVTLTYLKSLSLDFASYPQALGTAGCGCETRAVIRATGGNIVAAALSSARVSNGNIEFNLTCADGRQQVLQVSRDFTHWSDMLITNAPSSSFVLRFAINPAEHAIAIRVRSN